MSITIAALRAAVENYTEQLERAKSLRMIPVATEEADDSVLTPCTIDSTSLGVVIFLAEYFDEVAGAVAQPLRTGKKLDQDVLRLMRKAIRMMDMQTMVKVHVKSEVGNVLIYDSSDWSFLFDLDQIDGDTIPGMISQIIAETDNLVAQFRIHQRRINDAMAVHSSSGMSHNYR